MSKHNGRSGGDDPRDEDESQDVDPPRYEIRQAVFARDRKCVNCGRPIEEGVTHDADHIVPRSAGGANRHSNVTALCRQCHDAKHGDGTAPTIACKSTGEMTDREFIWFKHFLTEMIPALVRILNDHHGTGTLCIRPYFGIDDGGAWHYPVGDLQVLDRLLSELDDYYPGLGAEQSM